MHPMVMSPSRDPQRKLPDDTPCADQNVILGFQAQTQPIVYY